LNFLLVTLVLALHLACMNAATGGPLVCVWLDWRERRGDGVAGRAGRFLAGWSVLLFVAGLALGLATAVLVWNLEFWRELRALLPSRIFWGYWELGFSFVLMAGHWGWWRMAPGKSLARVGRSLAAVLASTNLLYHFPPLFVVAAMVASGEAASLGEINDATFPRLIWRGEVFALTVHFWLASLAVTGVLLAGYALRENDGSPEEQTPAKAARWGGLIALVSTLLQIPVGLWLMMVLPPLRQNQLLGGNLAGTSLLAAGVLIAVFLLHVLAGMTLGDTRRATILRAAVLILSVIVVMTAVLRWSRPERPATPQAASGFSTGLNLNCRPAAEHRRQDIKEDAAQGATGPSEHDVLGVVDSHLHPADDESDQEPNPA
jgi:hypothetical protein